MVLNRQSRKQICSVLERMCRRFRSSLATEESTMRKVSVQTRLETSLQQRAAKSSCATSVKKKKPTRCFRNRKQPVGSLARRCRCLVHIYIYIYMYIYIYIYNRAHTHTHTCLFTHRARICVHPQLPVCATGARLHCQCVCIRLHAICVYNPRGAAQEVRPQHSLRMRMQMQMRVPN
jgi:hypothetical protein